MSYDRRTFLTAAVPAALAPATASPDDPPPGTTAAYFHAKRQRFAAYYDRRRRSPGVKLAAELHDALKRVWALADRFLDEHGDECSCGFCVAHPDPDRGGYSPGAGVAADVAGSLTTLNALIHGIANDLPPELLRR